MSLGSCLCGTVRFEVDGPYHWFGHCHCSMCRKQHGTLHATNILAARSNFRFLNGQDAVVRFRASPAFERPFCGCCGSKAPDTSGKFVRVPAGTLEGELDAAPSAHIFVAHRSTMETITDSLPQFDSYPPGFGAALGAPAPTKDSVRGVQGGCLCGDVAFVIDVVPSRVVQCHCSRCRRSRGTAHGVNTFVADDQLRFTRGAELVQQFSLPDSLYATSFCRRCGSLLPTLFAASRRCLVPVGALDTPFALRGGANVYVGSKASWHNIADSYPQFVELPPRERLADLL